MSLGEIEKVIWWFTIVFLLCFYLALAVAPVRLFMGYGELGKEIDTERGLSRIRLTLIGGGPLFIAYFLAIGKLKKSKNVKKWFALVVLFFVTIVLQLGRQAILLSLLLGVLFYMKEMSFFKKVGVIGLICGSALLVPILAPTIIEGLQGRTNQEIEAQQEGEDNVRIAAYKFYFTEVSRNVLNDVFGNGMFTLGKSKYGHFIDYYGRSRGLIPNDVGYASIFLYFGFFGLLIFLSILWLVLWTSVPPEYEYAKFYVYFLFLGNVAGSTLLGTIPTFCMALYIISLGKRKLQYMKRLAAPPKNIYGSSEGSLAI
ncbi:MAG: hypothetical protein NXI00_06155 [Cytophagales bacterium]|nr:hypothetical protein [Cytophagales bacterium]